MTEDEQLMSEEIHLQQDENRRLLEENRALRGKLRLAALLPRLLLLVPLALSFLLIWASYKWIATPRVPSFCIIRPSGASWNPYVDLKGIVEWGEDIDYGRFYEIKEARARAAEFGCPVRDKQ
jgi:hypothetical protein